MARDKGCEIYYRDEAYPVRSFIPDTRGIEITRFKRALPLFFRFLTGKNKTVLWTEPDKYDPDEFERIGWFKKFLVIITLPIYYKFILAWQHWALRDSFMSENKYNQPAREMYRLIKNVKVRDLVCAILEYDLAYKFRFQDIASQINKRYFMQDPFKEIKRLVKLIQDREVGDGMKVKWSYINLGLWYLKINRKLLKELKEIVLQLDVEAISPTPADTYWMCSPPYEGYNFAGLSFKERLMIYYGQKNDYINKDKRND